MGKKSKVGKQRKDRFYQLAKETGYRSRAAFKLIQLNRKFEFLQKSQVCLDLCAAPGGWMQVAKQNMPVSSVVIGVDLFPIKPIAGCISLIGDITTDKCRQDIGKELQNWKADLVLHDGAPNVGQNWLYDAYQQSALTLSALKLATGFLRQGGWFVTKVFRSKDYNPLLWVFKQLFKKVHASKPQASRAESAEIFVVCQGYLAPAKLDPRFLDLKYVFQEVDMEPTAPTKFLRPDKQKKLRAEGYSEKRGVYNPVSVLEFVKSDSPVDLLQVASCLTFDSEEVSKDPSTTTEIRECCKDIKVLGRKDLKDLMAWGKALKKKYFSDDKEEVKKEGELGAAETSPEVAMSDDEKELVDMDSRIDLLELEEARALKKKRKRANKERSKLQEKLNLKMVFKNDAGPIEEDEQEPLFNLHLISSKKILEKIDDQKPDVLLNSDEEEEDENIGSFRSSFIPYDRDGTRLDKSGKFYIGSDDEETEADSSEADSDYDTDREELGFSDDDEKPRKKLKKEPVEEEKKEVMTTKKKKSVRFSESVKMEDSGDKHPLLTDLDQRDRETKRLQRAHLWFQKDAFKGLEKEDEEEYELEEMAKSLINKGGDVIEQKKSGKSRVPAKVAPPAPLKEEEEEEAEGTAEEEDTSDSDSDSDYDVESAHRDPIKVKGKDGGFEIAPKEKKPKKIKLSESELALGAVMVGSRKARRDIVDGAWNRYSFNDTNLPDWFVEDEKKHMRKEAPVPKELVEEYKKKQEELNTRPIKKVIEARARKKKRALKKLERAKKKLEGLMEHPDVSEKEKARQIRRLYKKAKDEKKEITYVVSRKHTAGKRMRRPPGVKGRYRIVDPRLKKDKRATSAKQARQTKSKKRR